MTNRSIEEIEAELENTVRTAFYKMRDEANSIATDEYIEDIIKGVFGKYYRGK